MRIVCWHTILMKYHTSFFFEKLGKMSPNLSSVAVVIGAFRVKCTMYIVAIDQTRLVECTSGYKPINNFYSPNKINVQIKTVFSEENYVPQLYKESASMLVQILISSLLCQDTINKEWLKSINYFKK